MRQIDRMLYYSLVFICFSSFISACILLFYNLNTLQSFWVEASMCYPNEDFHCLSEAVIKFDEAKRSYYRVIGGILSIASFFSSAVLLFIWQKRKVWKGITRYE